MNYQVIRPFRWNGLVRMPGQILELRPHESARLRSMGLIGMAGPERATKPPAERPASEKPDQAVKKPPERRGRKKKEQSASVAVEQESMPVEEVEDVADSGDAAGD